MELGLGKLGLLPEQFWRMTPPELTTAVYGRFGRPKESEKPMTKGRLQEMMERFPDGR